MAASQQKLRFRQGSGSESASSSSSTSSSARPEFTAVGSVDVYDSVAPFMARRQKEALAAPASGRSMLLYDFEDQLRRLSPTLSQEAEASRRWADSIMRGAGVGREEEDGLLRWDAVLRDYMSARAKKQYEIKDLTDLDCVVLPPSLDSPTRDETEINSVSFEKIYARVKFAPLSHTAADTQHFRNVLASHMKAQYGKVVDRLRRSDCIVPSAGINEVNNALDEIANELATCPLLLGLRTEEARRTAGGVAYIGGAAVAAVTQAVDPETREVKEASTKFGDLDVFFIAPEDDDFGVHVNTLQGAFKGFMLARLKPVVVRLWDALHTRLGASLSEEFGTLSRHVTGVPGDILYHQRVQEREEFESAVWNAFMHVSDTRKTTQFDLRMPVLYVKPRNHREKAAGIHCRLKTVCLSFEKDAPVVLSVQAVREARHSMAHVMASFDLKCCQAGYDGVSVSMTRDCALVLCRGFEVIDPLKDRGGRYGRRILKKQVALGLSFVIPGWSPRLLSEFVRVSGRSMSCARVRALAAELPGGGAVYSLLYAGYLEFGSEVLEPPAPESAYDFDAEGQGQQQQEEVDLNYKLQASTCKTTFPLPFLYGSDAKLRHVCTRPWLDGEVLSHMVFGILRHPQHRRFLLEDD